MPTKFVTPDSIRSAFSQAMSDLYRSEVPQYGALLELVADINQKVSAGQDSATEEDQHRITVERHGAIRVGTANELSTIRRLFNVMGMSPVGYYDLTVAGVPVHSTAFRPVEEASLAANPFRVFTSLLRLELIEDANLRQTAIDILSRRSIFTSRCVELIQKSEAEGGLASSDADEFVREAIETFRWHEESTVSAETYRRLRSTHPLIADVVSFRGPHINHLTPRTLDIDAVQNGMSSRGIKAKAIVEGPPKRKVPILLRQTSFLALNEKISFIGEKGEVVAGTHTARFGEIEQRGIALTPCGRALYDEVLAAVRREIEPSGDGSNAAAYAEALKRHFTAFPDDCLELHRQGLAFFCYSPAPGASLSDECTVLDLHQLVLDGKLKISPLTYEDFLPVSAAGIFQSNLGDEARGAYVAGANRRAFEEALGASVRDEMALYEAAAKDSAESALAVLRSNVTAEARR